MDTNAAASLLFGLGSLIATLQFGNALPKNILGCVEVAGVDRATLGADPLAVFERQPLVDVTAGTRLGGRIEAVNLVDGDTIFASHIFKFGDKFSVSQIRHLATPKTCHASERQILKEDVVIPHAKVVRELPLKVVTPVGDAFILPTQISASALTVAGAFLALGKSPRLFADIAKGEFEIPWTLHGRPIRHNHIRLQSEINPHGCTIMCLFVGFRLCVGGYYQIVFAKRGTFECDPFNIALVGTRIGELKPLLDTPNCNGIAIESKATLLENEGHKFSRLLEFRWALRTFLKETLICYVKPFKNLLHCLRMKQMSNDSFLKVLLHQIYRDELTEHPIVSLLQSEGVIPHKASLSKHRVKMPRPLCPI